MVVVEAGGAPGGQVVGRGDVQLLPYLNAYLQVQDDAVPAECTLEAAIDLVLDGIRSNERP